MLGRRLSLKAMWAGAAALFGLKTSSIAKTDTPTSAGAVLSPSLRLISILVGNSSYEWQDGKGWIFIGKRNMANHWSRHGVYPHPTTVIEPYVPSMEGTEMERRNLAIKAADEALARERYPDYKPSRT